MKEQLLRLVLDKRVVLSIHPSKTEPIEMAGSAYPTSIDGREVSLCAPGDFEVHLHTPETLRTQKPPFVPTLAEPVAGLSPANQ